jgi:hypothetical protein
MLYLIKIDDVFYSEIMADFRFNLMYFRQEFLNQILIYLNYLIPSVSFRLNKIINNILKIV